MQKLQHHHQSLSLFKLVFGVKRTDARAGAFKNSEVGSTIEES